MRENNMTTLNLHDINKSDIKFEINRFPDGEVQVTGLEVDKFVEGMYLIAPIRNAEELFILEQMLWLIHEKIHCVNIVIPYLMGARNDRVMDEGRCPTLYSVLWNLSCNLFPKGMDTLRFITVHNEKAVGDWFDDEQSVTFVNPYPNFSTNEEEIVIFPDAGAERRFKHLVTGPYLTAEKHRDINHSQSKIMSYGLENTKNYDLSKIKKVIVVDDLIDGGFTFRLLSTKVHEMLLNNDFTMELYATHFIQEDSLLALTEYYDDIFVCDTYRPLPSHKNIHKLKEVEEMI
jgi:phosphoribosylpyrophosphate synthetase